MALGFIIDLTRNPSDFNPILSNKLKIKNTYFAYFVNYQGKVYISRFSYAYHVYLLFSKKINFFFLNLCIINDIEYNKTMKILVVQYINLTGII